MNRILISPSILASDFSKLGEEAVKCEAAGADMLHIDVMDGHFVPNITLGPPVIRSLRPRTKLPFDVHLMISDPIRCVGAFADAGADMITFHTEATNDPGACIDAILQKGCKAGLALKPATPAEAALPYLDKLSMVLVMTVEPGFGGQRFMAEMLPKIRAVRRACDAVDPDMYIQVDGGITPETLPAAHTAGADVFVAGSYVFRAEDTSRAIRRLRGEDA